METKILKLQKITIENGLRRQSDEKYIEIYALDELLGKVLNNARNLKSHYSETPIWDEAEITAMMWYKCELIANLYEDGES